MGKTLSINKFATLLIASLADNSRVIDYNNLDNKVAVIPADYKQRIENIICAGNGWQNEFSPLININEYFEDHFAWEQQLATQIKIILKKMGKKMKYDIENDSIKISFSQKEVDSLLSNYKDNKVIQIMDHFVSLMGDVIYTREFQEEFHDYNAKSIQYMKKMKKNKESMYE